MLLRPSFFSTLFVILISAIVVRADEPMRFKYRLKPGSNLFTKSTSSTNTKQMVNGMNIESLITQESIQVLNIDETTAQGFHKFQTKAESLKSTIKIGGEEFQFDSKSSDRDKASVLGAALTPLYERIVGSELQGEITLFGEVKSLTGYAALVGDIVKNNPIASQFAGGGSDSVAKLGAQGLWLIFPDKELKIGDKWENPAQIELPELGNLKGKETVTFLAIETREGHSIARFATSNDLSIDVKLERNGTKVTGTISTSNSSGSTEFDVTAGSIVKRNVEIELSGQLNLDVNGMSLPVQVNQKVKTDYQALDKIPD